MAANPYDLTTREVLSIVFKERLKLIGIFAVLVALVVGYSLVMTRSYQASARLLVKSGREFQVRSDPNQPVASVPTVTKQEIVNSEIQILTSRDLIEAVINKIGSDRLYPPSVFSISSFFSSAGKAATEAEVRAFEGDFRAAPVELADVIEVSFRNPNAALAVETLNTIIDLYQKKHAEMFADPRYKSLEQQTAQYEQQLDQAGQKVTQIKSSQGVFDVDAQRSKLIDDRAATNTILQQLQATSVELHGRIEHLSKALKTTPQMVSGTSTQSDVLDQALARLLDTEVKAQQLRERYVGDVKPLQDARQEAEKLHSFIKTSTGYRKSSSQRNPTFDDMSIALSRAEADAAPLDQQIAVRGKQYAEIDARLRKLEEGGKALDDAQRERRTLEELVHTYRTQYEAARLAEEQNSANAVSVSLVQKPVASDQRFPSRMPFAFAGILIGLVGAAGMLVYLLVFRETLITVESVERIIGVPVLASVPNSRRSENDNRRAAA